jgi:hypothetical protein
MGNDERAWSWSRTLVGGAVAWLFLVALLVLLFLPNLPQSALQWVLLVVLGPPAYVLGEAFFGWLLSREHGTAISRRRFSIKRIAVLLLVFLAVFALSWWLSLLLTAP